MKNNTQIQSAMDESLSSVHFDARDMHAVMRSARQANAPRPSRRKGRASSLALAAATAVLVLLPAALLLLRAGSMAPKDIATITADGVSAVTSQPDDDPVIVQTSPSPAITEDDVIAAVRACFEANCNTEVFRFDEYTVDIQQEYEYGSDPADPAARRYAVTMKSIYNNGCVFRVILCALSGEVISFSEPQLATVPVQLDSDSPEIQSWYEKYGAHPYIWPLEIQAEFSRRYEGAMLRMPREDELDTAAIGRKLGMHYQTLIDACTGTDCTHHTVSHGMSLRSGQAYEDGQARYLVYCFLTDDLSAPLPDLCMRLTFLAADGTLEAKEILPTSEL